MSYQPHEGTVAYRALAWLKARDKLAPGFEAASAVLAEGIDTDAALVSSSLLRCVEAGLVKVRTKPENKRLLWWSLGDGKPLVKEPDVLPHRNEAPDVKPLPGAMFPGGIRGDEPVDKPAPDAAAGSMPSESLTMRIGERRIGVDDKPPVVAEGFDVWLSARTGGMVLIGVQLDDDGHLTLQHDQVRMIRRALGAPPQ